MAFVEKAGNSIQEFDRAYPLIVNGGENTDGGWEGIDTEDPEDQQGANAQTLHQEFDSIIEFNGLGENGDSYEAINGTRVTVMNGIGQLAVAA